jgi:thioesterase domain-containing protein
LVAQGHPVAAVCLFDGNILPGPHRIKVQVRNRIQRMAQAWGRGLRRSASRDGNLAPPDITTNMMPPVAPAVLSSASWDERWPYVNRIWIHVMWHYWPRQVATRGILFRAQDDNSYYSEHENPDGCLGWSKLFAEGLEVVPVSGSHFTMWEEPHLQGLRQAWTTSLRSLTLAEKRSVTRACSVRLK